MGNKKNILLIGKKLSMESTLNEANICYTTTIIQCYPCQVHKISVLNYGEKYKINIKYFNKEKNIGNEKIKIFKHKEFKTDNLNSLNDTKVFSISDLSIGDLVNVSGHSIGKGNGSNIKRNNFQRGPMSHGSKHIRLQGSLGAGTTPGRVFPGKKMPGRLGGDLITIKNLLVMSVNSKENKISIRGSVPGKAGSILKIISA